MAQQLYGAQRHKGQGHVGQSYAIPTRRYDSATRNMVSLSFQEVIEQIADFCEFTKEHPELEFFVTAVGCGRAGFDQDYIAPLFRDAINCSFPLNWFDLLEH